MSVLLNVPRKLDFYAHKLRKHCLRLKLKTQKVCKMSFTKVIPYITRISRLPCRVISNILFRMNFTLQSFLSVA